MFVGLKIVRMKNFAYFCVMMKKNTRFIEFKSKVQSVCTDIILPALTIVGWSLKDLWESFMCPKRSSAALTYHTLFAIVPVLSLMVAVAKGLGYANEFKAQVSEFFYGQEMVSSKLLAFTDSYLDNTHLNSWLGASVGLVVLLYSVFSIFQTIDQEFNHQWEERGRSFLTLLKTFAFVLVIPFAVIVLLAIWWSVSSYFHGSLNLGSNTLFLSAGAYVLLLFLMYKLIPKCKVVCKFALLSATVCGIIFCAMQYFSYSIIMMFGNYRNVYGDLATLIIFLLWIYFSWTICLAGAHWTYLLQSARTKRILDTYRSASSSYQRFLMTVVVLRIRALHPNTGQFLWSEVTDNFVSEYGLAEHIVEDLLQILTNRGVLKEVEDEYFVVDSEFTDMTAPELYAALDDAGNDSAVIEELKSLHADPQLCAIWNEVSK